MKTHPDVTEQIDAVPIDGSKPLIITDADEVLVQFITGLDSYLQEQGLYLDLQSFAITGNVKRQSDHVAVDADVVQENMQAFFEHRTAHLPAVPGAAEALQSLSERAQIIVLSNVPLDQKDARIEGLQRIGVDYPVIANIGLKGAAIRDMTAHMDAPIFFLDDIPHNIDSAAEHADHVHRIHFVADPRLARLIDQADGAHTRIDDWPAAHDYIHQKIDESGH